MVAVEYYKDGTGMAVEYVIADGYAACKLLKEELPSTGYDYAIVTDGSRDWMVTPESITEVE